MGRTLLASMILLAACPANKDAAKPEAKPQPAIADPAGTIRDAKADAERALKAGERRNDAALERAMQGEAPSPRKAK